MSFVAKYGEFRFENYGYDLASRTLSFEYSFDGTVRFIEKTVFEPHGAYDAAALEKAAFLAFMLAGISYYKSQPTKKIVIAQGVLDESQAEFFSKVYRDGLSQFVYENDLSPDSIGQFDATADTMHEVPSYGGNGIAVLQSGGKDSLLLARMLVDRDVRFNALYMQQSESYPTVIDTLGVPLRRFVRNIDRPALRHEAQVGGLNGHVPVTFITLAYALVDTILANSNTVLAAIGREGEEPHAYIDDYPVTHQWSKTWTAEKMFAEYVARHVATGINVGSPLRGYSELKIAELFTRYCWGDYGHKFSSCNVANYRQGHDNKNLQWCGECPKCANSYLLFAAFVPRDELKKLFGRDLFASGDLVETFKGLLGIDGIEKPFECVGEIEELRHAYELSQSNDYSGLPFDVPRSQYDMDTDWPSQAWASRMIQ